MRLLQKVTIVGATISTILLRRKPPLAIALVLTAFYVHNFLRKFATAKLKEITIEQRLTIEV